MHLRVLYGLKKGFLESDDVMNFLKSLKYLMVDRGGEFYSDSIQDMLEDFDLPMSSPGSNVKASMAERLMRTLKASFTKTLDRHFTLNQRLIAQHWVIIG